MNELEKLALEHLVKMAKQIDNDMISIGMIVDEGKFNRDKHSYPIAGKAREMGWWLEAIINNKKDE